jgi:monofunctional glycosyltransferase
MKAIAVFVCLVLLLACADRPAAPPANVTEAPWTVRIPLWQRFSVSLSVPGVLRLATAPLGARLLDGRALDTRWGRVTVARATDGVKLRCAPCAIQVPAIGRDTLHFAAVELHLTRQGQALAGRLQIEQVALRFKGELSEAALRGNFELADTPISDVYALFGAAIPELQGATIVGRTAASGTFSLPDGALTLAAQVRGFEVTGLGTERLNGPVVHACVGADGIARLRAIGEGGRDWVAPKAMGKLLPRAVVASEDSRYFKHPGYDLLEARAALQMNLAARDARRGGSTITQQLARTLFLDQERTVVRKLRETLYAVEMEQTLGKERILALYLNTVDWGPGICGAGEAARAYFGKTPAKLRVEQAAWLAGILRNPHVAWREEYATAQPRMQRVAWVVKRMRGLRRGERIAALRRPLRFHAVPVKPVQKGERELIADCNAACQLARP